MTYTRNIVNNRAKLDNYDMPLRMINYPNTGDGTHDHYQWNSYYILLFMFPIWSPMYVGEDVE